MAAVASQSLALNRNEENAQPTESLLLPAAGPCHSLISAFMACAVLVHSVLTTTVCPGNELLSHESVPNGSGHAPRSLDSIRSCLLHCGAALTFNRCGAVGTHPKPPANGVVVTVDVSVDDLDEVGVVVAVVMVDVAVVVGDVVCDSDAVVVAELVLEDVPLVVADEVAVVV